MTITELTYYTIADRIIGKSDSKIYVDWAIDMISKGHESENILILAGLDHSDSEERENYLRECLHDLKIDYPADKKYLFNFYSINLSKKVIKGDITPQTGLTKMNELFFESDYANYLSAFQDLQEDIDYLKHSGQTIFNSGLKLKNIDKYIINEFQLFLDSLKFEGKDFSNKVICKKCDSVVEPEMKKKWSILELKRQNFYCCPKCSSKDLSGWSSQTGKKLIIDKMTRNNLNIKS